jgi:hypothetical protein
MQERFALGKKLLLGTLLCFFGSLLVFILNGATLKNSFLAGIALGLIVLSMVTSLILVLRLIKTAASEEEALIHRHLDSIRAKLGPGVYYTPHPSFETEQVLINPATEWNHANAIETAHGFEGNFGGMPFKAYELRTVYYRGGKKHHASCKFRGYIIMAQKPLTCRKEISIRTKSYFHPLYMNENEPYSIKNPYNAFIKTFYPFITQNNTFDAAFNCLLAHEADVQYLLRHEALCRVLVEATGKTARDFSVFISPQGYIALSVRELSFSRLDPVRDPMSFEEHFERTLGELSFFMNLLHDLYTQLD